MKQINLHFPHCKNSPKLQLMAKPDGTVENSSEEEEAKWGTWEELLLAFAVNRYGTKSWDSVAVELQKRSTAPAKLLSAPNCKLKYLDLKRRYVNDDDEEKTEALLEELRKLRVAELKREVEKYDLSIVSLQLKKKQLEEERAENGGYNSDLAKKIESEIKPEQKSSPELDAAGDESEEASESSSTGPKQSCSIQTGTEDNDKKPESVRTGSVKEEPVGTGSVKEEPDKCSEEKPVREDSYNGSSDSVEKPVKVEPVSDSDVQSSISKRVNDKVLRGCSSGDEREKEDNRSPTAKEIPVEYQPLIAFLDKITNHKLGSIFARRLESQETEMYSNLVRQHVDLETVRTWLENGRYLSCKSKFFRDLLLLASNAIVFFKKSSQEFVAATELRQLILKEIPQTKSKSDSSPGKQTSLKPASLAKKEIAKPPDSLLLKTNISRSMIVCRKRSSIASKASASASGGGDKMREQTITLPGENVVVDALQQPTQLATNDGENRITKKRRQDRSASASASLKKNEKSRSNSTSIKTSAAVVDRNQGKGESSSQHQQSKVDNRKELSNTDVKKRSAANFLNRMKQSSSSNSGLLLDALKSTPLSSDSKGGLVQKKKDGGTGGGRKELAASKNLEAKQGKEKGSPMKKNIGRPPKRGADPSPTSGKQSREGAESAAVAPKQPKKRTRR